jgi:hypothetical protein
MLRKRRVDAMRIYQEYTPVHFGTDALALKGSGLPCGPSSTLEYGSEDFQRTSTGRANGPKAPTVQHCFTRWARYSITYNTIVYR